MTSGLERWYGGKDLHFITCSCFHRHPYLRTPERRYLFLRMLEEVRRRYRFMVLGYVVMPEHFHLLVSEPDEKNLSEAMHALKSGFARRVFGEARRRDMNIVLPRSFWQPRFYDFNVCSAPKQIEKLRYIHRNPVERGLVSSPELWMWSSYRRYVLLEEGPVRLNDASVLSLKVNDPSGFGDLPISCPRFRKPRNLGHPYVSGPK